MSRPGSNEYTYRENWSKFVDGAIARRASRNKNSSRKGGGRRSNSKGGKMDDDDAANFITYCETDENRVNFRDLMHLEEVLSRLQGTGDDRSRSKTAAETYGSGEDNGGVRNRVWEQEEGHSLKSCGGGAGGGEIPGRLKSPDRKPLASLSSFNNNNNNGDDDGDENSNICSPAPRMSKIFSSQPFLHCSSPRPISGAGRPRMPFITSTVDMIDAGRQADEFELLRQACEFPNSRGGHIPGVIKTAEIIPDVVFKMENSSSDEVGHATTSSPIAETSWSCNGVRVLEEDQVIAHSAITITSQGMQGFKDASLRCTDLVCMKADTVCMEGTSIQQTMANVVAPGEGGACPMTCKEQAKTTTDGGQSSPVWDETRIDEDSEDTINSMHTAGTLDELVAMEKFLLADVPHAPVIAHESDTPCGGDFLGVTVLDCTNVENNNRAERVPLSEEEIVTTENTVNDPCSSPVSLALGDTSIAESDHQAAFPAEATQIELVVKCGQSQASEVGRPTPALFVSSLGFDRSVNDETLDNLDVTHVEAVDEDNVVHKREQGAAGGKTTSRLSLTSEIIEEDQGAYHNCLHAERNNSVHDETTGSKGFADSPEIIRSGSAAGACGADGDVGDKLDSPFSRGVGSRREGCDGSRQTMDDAAESLVDDAAVPRMSLEVSQEGHETFESTLSPAIGGFGLFDGGDALSPVAGLREPLFTEVSDFGEEDDDSAGWESPTLARAANASSPRPSVASTASFEPTPTGLRESSIGANEEVEEESKEIPLGEPTQPAAAPAGSRRSQRSSFPGFREEIAESNQGKIIMPPPPPPLLSPPRLEQQRGQHRQQGQQYTSPAFPSSLLESTDEVLSEERRTSNTGASRVERDITCSSASSQSPAEEDRLSPATDFSTRGLMPLPADTHLPRRQLVESFTVDSPAFRTRGRIRRAMSSPRAIVPAAAEQPSICSFSENEGGDRMLDNFREYAERERRELGSLEADGDENLPAAEAAAAADLSLTEGTPRRRWTGSGEEFGFYAPLSVTYPANKNHGGQTATTSTLSSLQRSTLEWMLWRETGEPGGGRRMSAASGGRSPESTSGRLENDLGNGAYGGGDLVVNGGMLVHLSSQEASVCLMALFRSEAEGGAPREERSGRAGFPYHPSSGLPQGTTLLVTPTREEAIAWSELLGASSCGLSVLSYIMPLRERRRLTARQVASFDVVVTTYDILKAKEVPRVVEPEATSLKSPRSCRRAAGEWRSRIVAVEGQTKTEKQAATTKMSNAVSLLHGVWWGRVVADGAEILVNPRSARAEAASGLVGRARWCMVDRENVDAIENSSDRMWSLVRFLRVPAEIALVEAAGCLFYSNRPSHVAPAPRSGSSYLSERNNNNNNDGDGSDGSHCRHGGFSPCTPGGVRARARTLGLSRGRQEEEEIEEIEEERERQRQRDDREHRNNSLETDKRVSVSAGCGKTSNGPKGWKSTQGREADRPRRRQGGRTGRSKSPLGGRGGRMRGVPSRRIERGRSRGQGDGVSRGGGAGLGLRREDVTYVEKALCFRRVQDR